MFDASVNYSVVSGGAALLAGSLVAGTGTLTSVLGVLGKKNISSDILTKIIFLPHIYFNTFSGIGGTILGGNMLAQNMCLGEFKHIL